jgi:hypothetical protein
VLSFLPEAGFSRFHLFVSYGHNIPANKCHYHGTDNMNNPVAGWLDIGFHSLESLPLLDIPQVQIHKQVNGSFDEEVLVTLRQVRELIASRSLSIWPIFLSEFLCLKTGT